MDRKTKIILIQSIIIVALVISLVYYVATDRSQADEGLLSSRVYSGILPAESHLIFNLKPLERDLVQYLDENKINASVYLVNLRDGASFGIREDQEFDPLSLNKLPIAIIILEKVEEGELDLDQEIKIRKEFIDKTSGSLYRKNLTEISIRDLIRYMLTESDNTATHALLSLISFDEMERLSNYLNYYNPALNASAPSAKNNLFITSPKSTYNIFMSLYLSTVLKPENSEYILSLLTKTSFDIHKAARLPKEVVVAQKYGEYYRSGSEMFHSCGIMYIQESRFFYCVMTSGLSQSQAQRTIGEMVSKIYVYIDETLQNLRNYKL